MTAPDYVAKLCSVKECGRPHLARGWCVGHYRRWQTGRPLEGVMGRKTRSLEDKMLHYVQVTGFCWLWMGARTGGYGNVRVNGRTTKAHRAVYEHLVGPIPEGMHLDHLCRTKACVNPDHLEPVTGEENSRRAVEAQVSGRDWDYCPNDHRYTPENTYVRTDGTRSCRTCGRNRAKRKVMTHDC